MNRCCLLAGATLLAAIGFVSAQPPPFAPPGAPGATLLPPTAAPPGDFAGPPVFGPPPVYGPPPAAAERVLNEGWLAGLQLGLIRPHFRGNIPGGPLDTTVSPTVDFGYQFPSMRAILFKYRYFGASGDSTFQFANDIVPTTTHRHTEGHLFDLDVRFLEGGWALLRSQWELGVRAANISVYGFQPSLNNLSLVSNRFEGVGPHIDYKLAFTVFDSGLEFFGRADIGLLLGHNRGFSQVPDPPGSFTRVDWRHDSDSALAWTGRWQLGASYWFRWRGSRVLLTGGYEVDSYYFARAGERVGNGGGGWLSIFPFRYEPGDVRLVNTGPFVRLEFKY